MTPLSHESARKLIQYRLDGKFDPKTQSILENHLQSCTDCSNYAGELERLGQLIQQAMKSKWTQSPAPLPMQKIVASRNNKGKRFAGNYVAIRSLAIALMTMALFLSTWKFSVNLTSSLRPEEAAIPIPTPSALLTSTIALTQSCDYILYRVQKTDTWDSVALQFSVSKEALMEINGASQDVPSAFTEIKIPLCNRTPTVTGSSPTNTITITPQIEAISRTPG